MGRALCRAEESSGFLEIINTTNGSIVCARASVAATFLKRLIGFIGRCELLPGEGMLIPSTSAVHTVRMQFPIDLIALGRDLQVLECRSSIQPNRIAAFSLKTRSVLELRAGQLRCCKTCAGDRLLLGPASYSAETIAPAATAGRLDAQDVTRGESHTAFSC